MGQKILHRFNSQSGQILRPLFPYAGHSDDGNLR